MLLIPSFSGRLERTKGAGSASAIEGKGHLGWCADEEGRWRSVCGSFHVVAQLRSGVRWSPSGLNRNYRDAALAC
jgi:hypothetical protein